MKLRWINRVPGSARCYLEDHDGSAELETYWTDEQAQKISAAPFSLSKSQSDSVPEMHKFGATADHVIGARMSL
jgi:hypothetical protein